MPLKVVGPRVLLRPIQQAPKSDVIHLTDREPPTVGEVVGIGSSRCEECDAKHVPPFGIGDVVLIPATAGQEIRVDDEALWVVPISQVLSYWQPEPEESINQSVSRYTREHWIHPDLKQEPHA